MLFRSRTMLENGLLHGIGSDTHNMEMRPPEIALAEKKIKETMGEKMIKVLTNFSESLLRGDQPESIMPVRPSKAFFSFLKQR